ncbi:MAG TPA: putative toxin-antitoxin system toxin component, PIN family [Ktedonobacterales bacterium]|nr:putative toxin-antitoxin system toxin component, PIN family [Ktedonobacterales bacterium]
MTTPDLPDPPGWPSLLRTVCDTNVLVSGILFPRSIPGQAVAYACKQGVLLTTHELVTELRDVLARPKFDRYITRTVRDEFLAGYIVEAEFVPVIERVAVCRDPKDDRILDATINGRATCIISGDDDLLTLRAFRGIPVLTPGDFLART